MLGALLDAHPNVLIANEFNLMKRLKFGYHQTQLFYLLMRYSQKLAKRGRIASGYDYRVPNQWQGKFTQLKIIGDKKGGGSVESIRKNPALLDKLHHVIKVKIKCLHFMRNPYDNITTMARRKKAMGTVNSTDLARAISSYFRRMETIQQIKNRRRLDILDMRHEDFIQDPQAQLEKVCEFLQIEASHDYLQDCASIVYTQPHRSRHKIDWPPSLIERVRKHIASYPFLADYTFDN